MNTARSPSVPFRPFGNFLPPKEEGSGTIIWQNYCIRTKIILRAIGTASSIFSAADRRLVTDPVLGGGTRGNAGDVLGERSLPGAWRGHCGILVNAGLGDAGGVWEWLAVEFPTAG
jgi:hypothetical protein